MIEHKKSSATMIFNDQGELALQLRAAHDDSFPSHWDFSAGGGIDSGEDEKASAEREVKEELGVETSTEFVAQEHFTYPAWKPDTSREADLWIYRAHHNGPFSPDSNEVDDVRFFPLDAIKRMMESGEKFHPEFVLAWEKGLISTNHA
jgi:isopentenyldiphosphate isomerase